MKTQLLPGGQSSVQLRTEQHRENVSVYRPAILFSICFLLCLGVMATGATVLLCLLALFISDTQTRDRVQHRLSAVCINALFSFNSAWHIEFEGLEKISGDDQFIVVANHQSLLDPFLLYGLPFPFKCVTKRWVFKIPVMGLALSICGHIAAERGKVMSACKNALARGSSLIIFPEGARSADGTLQHFRMGAFRLSTESAISILPIVIDGSRNILPKYSKVLAREARLRIRVLNPISPDQYDFDPERLRDAVSILMTGTMLDLREIPASEPESLS